MVQSEQKPTVKRDLALWQNTVEQTTQPQCKRLTKSSDEPIISPKPIRPVNYPWSPGQDQFQQQQHNNDEVHSTSPSVGARIGFAVMLALFHFAFMTLYTSLLLIRYWLWPWDNTINGREVCVVVFLIGIFFVHLGLYALGYDPNFLPRKNQLKFRARLRNVLIGFSFIHAITMTGLIPCYLLNYRPDRVESAFKQPKLTASVTVIIISILLNVLGVIFWFFRPSHQSIRVFKLEQLEIKKARERGNNGLELK